MALRSGRVGIHPSQVDPITGMLINGPTPGSVSFEDLSDAQISNPEVGQTLIYNGEGWENEFSSVSPTTLAALQDVQITDPEDGDYLTYDSTSEKWINSGEAPTPTYTDLTITMYGAVEDTISFTDAAGILHTEVFASGQSSKSVTFKINPSGSTTITFTSAVAKNPDSLSDAYSKTVTITNATTEVWLMPSSTKTLYWWGYVNSDLETLSSANGWSRSGNTLRDAVYNTNSIDCNGTSNYLSGVGTKTTKNATCYAIAQGVTIAGSDYANIMGTATKELTSTNVGFTTVTSSNVAKYSFSMTGTGYLSYYSLSRRSTLFAMWYE